MAARSRRAYPDGNEAHHQAGGIGIGGGAGGGALIPLPCSVFAKNLKTGGDTCLPTQMCSPFLLPGGVDLDHAEVQSQLAAGQRGGGTRHHQFGSRLLKARSKLREVSSNK